MHIGSVNVFEPGPLADDEGGVDIERIRNLIAVQLHKIPRFRQKLAYVPFTGAPVWIDDRSFNLDYHVRHTALPHRGDAAQLKRLASRIMSQPLDRRRPLWEIWIAEGLEGNRFALISKIHHAMADGISGVDLFSAIIGRSPDFEPGPAPAWLPRPAPGARDLLEHELRHLLSSVFDLLRGEPGARALQAPGPQDGSIATRLRQAAAAVSAGLGTSPPTPLNVDVGPNRRFEWLRTGLDALGEIRGAAGATLNDVVLAIVTGAVRGFLQRRGCSVRELDFRVMVPVSVRTSSEQGQLGNRVSQLVVHIPLEAADPLERLRLVCESTRQLKQSGQAEGGRVLTGLSELLLPSIAGALERVAMRYSFGNMIVTNVPGARFTAYLLGARLLESYPVVPLSSRQALNIAVLSYDSHLHWGINADYDAIPDVSEFAALLGEEAEKLHKHALARAGTSSGDKDSRPAKSAGASEEDGR
jgi:WS/DGAT/MGAT family acyltransferase